MSCEHSLCLDQLLEPDPQEDFLILNANASPSTFETGVVAIPLGSTQVDVAFVTQKLSDQYNFHVLAIENLVDPVPTAFVLTVVSRTKDGFSVLLNGTTDTENYKLRFSIVVVGT